MNTGERIKANRKKANLTQEELARKAGISVFTLQKYETGARNPKLTTLQKIANALNCPISELKSLGYFDGLGFIEHQAYMSIEEAKEQLCFELLRLMGYVIEFEGCLEVRDMYPYDNEQNGFLIDGEITKSCEYGDGPCKSCSKRTNTYYKITKGNISAKISCYIMKGYITMVTEDASNILLKLIKEGDNLTNQEFGI